MSPSKKRRAYKSGSITQRHNHPSCPPPGPDGKRPAHTCKGSFVGRYDAGFTKTGERRRPAVVRKTKGEVERALVEKIRRVKSEGLGAEHDDRITVRSWCETWLELHRDKVRPSTYTTNAGALRKWAITTIGSKRLTSLTPADIRAVGKAVTSAGLSTTTAHQAQSATLTMLRAARREGHSVPERVFDVELMPIATNDRDAIPEADAIALLEAATADPQEAARWGLALLAGIRPGEACGLRWSDVDLGRQLVTIEWQRQELPYVDRRDPGKGFRVPLNHESVHLTGTYHLTRPKTERGYRVVPLVDDVAAALLAWRLTAPPNPWDLVFVEVDHREGREGQPLVRSKQADARRWVELQDAAQVASVEGALGRRFAVYEARHTCATLLWLLNTPPPVIEQIAGHSAAVSRRHYAHVNRDAERKALVAVSERLRLSRA